jgi:hypothetical protein
VGKRVSQSEWRHPFLRGTGEALAACLPMVGRSRHFLKTARPSTANPPLPEERKEGRRRASTATERRRGGEHTRVFNLQRLKITDRPVLNYRDLHQHRRALEGWKHNNTRRRLQWLFITPPLLSRPLLSTRRPAPPFRERSATDRQRTWLHTRAVVRRDIYGGLIFARKEGRKLREDRAPLVGVVGGGGAAGGGSIRSSLLRSTS